MARPKNWNIRDAVANVIEGKTGDGTAPLGLAVPFTNDHEARSAAESLLSILMMNIEIEGLTPSPSQRTAFTAKLLTHLNKAGHQTDESIRRFGQEIFSLADPIREDPDVILSRKGVAGILRAHHQRSAQAAARLRRELAANIPARLVLWQSDDGLHRLEEATDPRHLQQDSAALSHCVGTIHNTSKLTELRVRPEHPNAMWALHYWVKIQSGETRILTLTNNGKPLATLDYDTAKRAIQQIRGAATPICEADGGTKLSREPRHGHYFEALCQALHATKDCLGLTGIADLPRPRPGHVLTRQGRFQQANTVDLDEVLTGHIRLTNDATSEFIARVASMPLIAVDVSSLDDDKLAELPGALRQRR